LDISFQELILILVFITFGYLYGKFSYYNKAEFDGRWRNNTLRSLRIWNLIHWYFGNTLINMPTSGGGLLACYPHMYMPMSAILLSLIPGDIHTRDIVLGVSKNLFKIPIVRELCLLFGCVSVAEDSIKYFLSSECNVLYVLLPGGASEMARGDDFNRMSHIGFLRIWKNMTPKNPLYPVYFSGEKHVFYVFPFFKRFRIWSARIFGYPFLSPVLLIPFPIKLTTHIGNPILNSETLSFDELCKKFFSDLLFIENQCKESNTLLT